MRARRAACAALGAAAAVASACSAGAQPAPHTWLVIISGASGEPRFATSFQSLGASFRDAATGKFGIDTDHAIWLAENPAADQSRITGKATKGAIDSAFARIAIQGSPADRLFVLLIGHGSAQGGPSRLNIPGPDVTAADFRSYLDRLPTQPVVFVNAASASGDFVRALSGKNRIVLTATKSSAEGNESVFARYFVQAYVADGADADKDGRVSVLEAFQFARREVQREYEQANKLLTEHAILDDDGDGVGHADASGSNADGARARSFYLAGPAGLTAEAAANPRAAALLADRARLESSIDSLRQRKSSMPDAAYQAALESLLLKLAETNQAIRQLGGKKP